MALKICPECGKSVSSGADKCPNCGCGLRRGFMGSAGTERATNWAVLVVLLVIGAFVAWQVLYEQHKKEERQVEKRQKEEEQQAQNKPTDQRREVFIGYWNAYVAQSKAANKCWENYLKATTNDEKRAQLQDCNEAWGRVEPYKPAGAEPQLADAIAGVKKAWIAEVDFQWHQVGAWGPDNDRETQLRAAVESAEGRLASVHNQCVHDIGGIIEGKDTSPAAK